MEWEEGRRREEGRDGKRGGKEEGRAREEGKG